MIILSSKNIFDDIDFGDPDSESFAYKKMVSRVRRRADALQARRWKRLSHQININPFIDSKIKRRGGLL